MNVTLGVPSQVFAALAWAPSRAREVGIYLQAMQGGTHVDPKQGGTHVDPKVIFDEKW